MILGDVYPGGPGADAGLEIGDVVLTLDGKAMENGRQFQVNLYRRTVGERVTLRVQRDSDITNFEVRVVERPDDPDRFRDMVHPDRNLVDELGILGVDYERALASKLPRLRKRSGVVVAARSVETVSFRDGGLLPGDVIQAVNRPSIATLSELRATLARLRPGDPLVLQIDRQERILFVGMVVE